MGELIFKLYAWIFKGEGVGTQLLKTKFALKDILHNVSLFRIIFLLNLFLGTFIFLDVAAFIFLAVMFPWAFFILKDKFKNKSIKEIYQYKLICLFLIGTLLTSIIHIKMSFPIYFAFDLIMIYYYAICFFIFFGFLTLIVDKPFLIKKEIIFILKFVIFFTTVTTLISLAIIPFRDQIVLSSSTNWGNFEYIIGVYKRPNVSRLSGFFDNPNILAFCSVVSLIFTHILFSINEFFKKQSKPIRILAVLFCVLINSFGLIFSDSIASFILLISYFTVYILLSLIKRHNNDNLKVKTIFFAMLIFLTVTFLTVHIIFQGGLQSNISSLFNNFFENFDKNINFKFGRLDYDLKYGSGRNTLIQQALTIFFHHPIFGIGISNIENFGKLYFESGIAFPNYILGIAFPNFHNGYLTILTCYGLIGFALFLIFIFKCLKNLVSHLFNSNNLNSEFNIIFSCFLSFIFSYFIFALFEKTFLSEINFMCTIFWAILGYSMYIYKNKIS